MSAPSLPTPAGGRAPAGRRPDTFRVARSLSMSAAPARAYAIIADYRGGHPLILPEPWFSNIRVEQGGVGAGTRFTFDVRVLGAERRLHGEIAEPEPGRVLVERVAESGVVTTFRVASRPDGGSDVTIETEMPRRPGLLGALERAVLAPFLRRLFAEELRRLARVASWPARVLNLDAPLAAHARRGAA